MPMRNVIIAEKSSNKVVHTQNVTLNYLNLETARIDFEDMAWTTAIEDGDVPREAKRSEYVFIVKDA